MANDPTPLSQQTAQSLSQVNLALREQAQTLSGLVPLQQQYAQGVLLLRNALTDAAAAQAKYAQSLNQSAQGLRQAQTQLSSLFKNTNVALRVAGTGLQGLADSGEDTGTAVGSLGSAISALPHPAAQAAGALTSLVGGIISFQEKAQREARKMLAGAAGGALAGGRGGPADLLNGGLRAAGAQQGIQRAMDRLLNPSLLGGDPVERALQELTAASRESARAMNRLAEMPPRLQSALQQALTAAGVERLRGMVTNTFAEGGASLQALHALRGGGTQAEARDIAERERILRQHARTIQRPGESPQAARDRALNNPEIRNQLNQMADAQLQRQQADFAAEALVRNQSPTDRARRRLRGLNQSLPAGAPELAEQRGREAADIFRQLRDSMEPMTRRSQAFEQFSPEAASAVFRAEQEQMRQNPEAEMVQILQAQRQIQAQALDFNRQAANALNQLAGMEV